MHTRTIGSFRVSAIGLGCMNMSSGYARADAAESERLLSHALEHGYRFFDTAALYGMGHNEELVGRMLHHQRERFVLASKCGFARDENGKTIRDGRPETVRRTCEESLRRLRSDVIDLYYLHRIDPDVPVEDSVGALARLVDAGKIRAIGLSEVATTTLRKAHAVHPVAAVQSEYSLWSRTPERGMLAACRELGVAFVPFSPLGRGFLAGSAKDVTQLHEHDLRCTIARPRFESENFQRNRQLLGPYREIASEQGCTMAQLALAWLLAREDGTLIPIPGTKDPAHMAENAAASEIRLDAGVTARLDALINESTVAGKRYTDELMTSTDSELD